MSGGRNHVWYTSGGGSGACCVDYTTMALIRYVSTTGSDATGDGSSSNPYATVEKALNDIPLYVRHECKIFVEGGNYSGGWPESVARIYEEEGSLAIIGVGAPQNTSGPHTITGAISLNLGGIRLTVGAGGLGAVDSLVGQHIVLSAGSSLPGYAYSIVGNTDTTIDIYISFAPPANGDVFDVVTPTAHIPVEGCVFRYDSRGLYKDASNDNCRFVMHNIKLDATASPKERDLFTFGSVAEPYSGFWLDFNMIEGPGGDARGVVTLVDAKINEWQPYSTDYVAEGLSGINNLLAYGKPGLGIRGGDDRDMVDVNMRGRSTLVDCAMMGQLWAEEMVGGGYNLGMANLLCFLNTRAIFAFYLIEGSAGAAAIELDMSTLRSSYAHILSGTDAFSVRSGSFLNLDSFVSCDVSGITGYGASISGISKVLQGDACGSLVGTSGAYTFTTPAVPINSPLWLATAGTSVTDGNLGCRITY